MTTREQLLRRKEELEREFEAIQEQLAQWESEVVDIPKLKRDRKKYTPLAIAKRERKEASRAVREATTRAVLEKKALGRAAAEAASRAAGLEMKEFPKPRWVMQKKLVRLRDLQLKIPQGYSGSEDPLTVAREFEEPTVERILKEITELGAIKIILGMTCRMVKPVISQETVYEEKFNYNTSPIYQQAKMATLTNADPAVVREFVRSSFAKMNEEFEKFVQNGSGWVIEAVEVVDMHIDRYRPGQGGSHMESPAWIVAKKCCVNVRNLNNDCFRYAVTAAVSRPEKHAERPAYYDHPERRKLLKLTGIEMPAKCCSSTFQKFEAQNPKYSLLVYQCPQQSKDRSELFPAYISPHEDRERIILVLLYDEKAEKGEKSHYITVTNVHALLKVDNNKTAHCLRCLHTFAGKDADKNLARHMENPCGNQCVELPTKGKNDVLRFEDFDKTLKVPYITVLDFESDLVPLPQEEQKCGESTERLNKHVANSYCFVTIGPNGERVKEFCEFYRGPEAARHCLQELQRVAGAVKEKLQTFKERPPLSPEDEAAWERCQICHLCGCDGMTQTNSKKPELTKAGKPKKCGPRETDKVRDHCHVTGEYRGAAHSKCNLKARTNYKLPVFVHNLKGYDAHLLFTAMGEVEGKLNVIATNSEKYVSFSLDNLVFKDSNQFLQASLATLANNLPKDKMRHTSELAFESGVELDLLRRKGIYPYSWANGDESKFAENQLPCRESFFNDLENEDCSESDYKHAQDVWRKADCQNFGDYHDLYLKLDVALLADVFENFRNTSMEIYGLDPAHYFTTPAFGWSAMLKLTGVELELLTDIDMYITCESALRGGVCAVSHRHVKANNPRVEGYDSTNPKTWLRYDDANNLYGWAMSQKLPIRDFRWGEVTSKCGEVLWSEKRVNELADDADRGAFLCVDLEYPAEIHDSHNDYPLCPERMNVPRDWLSPYQEALVGNTYSNCEKLVPNLRDKTKYWIHYRNLKFALNHGLKLKTIHRVLEFEQEAWMKPFIDFNTTKRAAARNDFEKDFFKLMNNACFGKTMEDMRKRRDIQALRVDSNAFRKWVAEPTYKGRKIVDDNLVIAERSKKKTKLFKPIYAGVAVLDLSKLHMWSFWYDYVKPKYGSDVRLCYTDTDSLVYEIRSETDPTLEFVGTKGSMFDTSDYPEGHPQRSNDNKKVLGKFKDEAMGVAISEFVGLRPKLYAIRYENGKGVKKAKGTKKCVVKKEIRFENYLTTLETRKSSRHTQMDFRTDCHKVYTTRITKTSLSALDTKRYILPDGVTTNAYGHYSQKNKLV